VPPGAADSDRFAVANFVFGLADRFDQNLQRLPDK